MPLTEPEEAAIRHIITQQLEALQSDRAAAAFACASPEIQTRFGTAAAFMQMVRQGYAPVCSPRSVVFEGVTQIENLPAQQVMLMDQTGNLIRALYVMQQQPDRTWRIAGCYLLPIALEEDIR